MVRDWEQTEAEIERIYDDMEVECLARRRYLSTKISLDKVVNRVAMEHGDFAALFYTWAIPHAEEDCTLTGDPEELRMQVIPGRLDKTAEDVRSALTVLADEGLILWNRKENLTQFPIESFYEYQTNITSEKRRTANISNDYQQSAKNSKKQQRTAQNASSSSLSITPSITNTRVRKRAEYDPLFLEFWKVYPKPINKAGTAKCWNARIKEGEEASTLIACAKNYADACKRRGTEPQYIMYPTTFLGTGKRYEEYMEPVAVVKDDFRDAGRPQREYHPIDEFKFGSDA